MSRSNAGADFLAERYDFPDRPRLALHRRLRDPNGFTQKGRGTTAVCCAVALQVVVRLSLSCRLVLNSRRHEEALQTQVGAVVALGDGKGPEVLAGGMVAGHVIPVLRLPAALDEQIAVLPLEGNR